MARGWPRRALHPLYRRLETRVHPLRYLFLEVTSRCNLRCRHCGSDCDRTPRDGELSTDEWLAVVDRIADGFDPRTLVLVLTGGEPLCRPDLDRILERIHARGLAWGMVTNGQALGTAALRHLLGRGLQSLTVSLDGLRPSHDALRGAPGAFDRALRAIRAAAEAHAAGLLRFTDVVTCVHPANLDELHSVRALLEASGVPAWRLFPIFPRGRAREHPDLLLGPAELRRLLDFIAAARRPPGALRIQLSCEGWLPPAIDRAVRDEPYFCRAGISVASVLCDGAIGACPSVSRALVQGNVRSDDLVEVWERRFAPHRERGWMRTGACAGCRDFPRCLGNSLHLWDGEAGATACCTRDAACGGAPPLRSP
ncbi:radical SAM protein [Anaeromyxobacter oryzae]|uniref:Radical SAM/SPASM domain-containing protein n=1 Tax=Anaeromyxobacter oryzae TaxID=2918170 RepID=A0ABM7WNU9_9BACT|nr:radical SAM protein [Anaeromyxobacter oryzae]BDG01138.1 radical SAM/SPASM domain-containing protein [Anaeromyxobacter oryzae]